MASLQERNGSYRVLFCYDGKLHTFTIGKVKQDEAENKAGQVDYLLMRLKQRLIVLPEGTDIVTFIEHDGKPPDIGPTRAEAPRQAVTLGHLKERYLNTHANGTIEANSLDTCRLHLGHFVRVLGEGFPLGELSLAKLQEYVNQRAKTKVSPVTIRKEIATLRAAWNWGEPMDLTSGRFPSKGLRYPKADEKPPFMTMEEIERQIDAGGDPDTLWEALYLQSDELMTPFLKKVLKEWLAIHPGGSALFCHAGIVARSKKRSRTTGHQNEKKRPSSLKGRMANVRKREQPAQGALTRNEVHDHFKRVLAGTKWEPMRGLHCLRHSFISACASKGVDQRLVQEWAGHMNEATSKRYRHLYPSTQQEAISRVFG